MTPTVWVKRSVSVLATVLVFVGTGAPATLSQRGPRDLGQGRGGIPPINSRPPIQEVIEGLYVSRFQEALQLEDEQFVALLPSLRDSLRRRNELSQRRNRALNELRQAYQNGATDDELNQLIEQFDRSDRELRAVQEDLLREVDPSLSPRQRARFRIVQPNVENRIRSLIDRSRSAAPAQRPPR